MILTLALLFAAVAQDADVVYRTIDNAELKMDIARPTEGAGPFPAVICLHGGGWSMGGKGSYRKILPELAANGFVAASIQYRLTPAARFPAQIEDTIEAIRFLRANAAKWNIDTRRIVLLGASAGAHLALLTGFSTVDTKDAVQAIVDISAPTDLRDWKMSEDADQNLQKTTGKSSETLIVDLLGTSDRGAKIVRDASPMLQVRRGAPPVLTFHWKNDRAVAPEQVERLIKALSDAGVKHEAVWFEGRGHALMGAGVETIVPRTVEFLNGVFGLRPVLQPNSPAR